MKKYWTTNKNGDWVWVDKKKAIELVSSGKKTKEDFIIEEVDESMSTEGMLPGEVEAQVNAPVRKQMETYNDMMNDIASGRENELRSTLLGQLFPYTAKQLSQTGEGTFASGAKDVAAYVPRGIMQAYDLAFGSPEDLGKTSEEYAKEGRMGRSILTSPLIAPNVAAGVLSGGMSVPAQVAIQGGTGVIAGGLMDENYGGNDALIDIGLSALPAAGTASKALLKAKGAKNIEKAILANPELRKTLDQAARTGEKESRKVADILAPMPDAFIVTSKEIDDIKRFRESLIPRTTTSTEDYARSLGKIVQEEGYSAPSLRAALGSSVEDIASKINYSTMPSPILDDNTLGLVVKKSIDPSDFNKTKKSLKLIDEFRGDQELLDKMLSKIVVDPGDNSYEKEVLKILGKYQGEPILYEAIWNSLAKQPNMIAENLLKRGVDDSKTLKELYDTYKNSAPSRRLLELQKASPLIQSMEPPTVPMNFEHPFVSLGEKTKQAISSDRYAVSPTLADKAGKIAGVPSQVVYEGEPRKENPAHMLVKGGSVPVQVVPKYTNRSGYSSKGDLLYAPRGYITYDDLWKEAEKVKKKLPSLEIH